MERRFRLGLPYWQPSNKHFVLGRLISEKVTTQHSLAPFPFVLPPLRYNFPIHWNHWNIALKQASKGDSVKTVVLQTELQSNSDFGSCHFAKDVCL